MSGHHALANTLALQQRGVGEDTADPPGGRLVRDDQGRLTGYCLDAAQALVVPRGRRHRPPRARLPRRRAPRRDRRRHRPRVARLPRRGDHIDRRCTGDPARARRVPRRARTRRARRPCHRDADLITARRVRLDRDRRSVRRRPAGDRADEVLLRWRADRRDRSVLDTVWTERRVHRLALLAVGGRFPRCDLARPRRRLADRDPCAGRPGDRPRARCLRGGAGCAPARRPSAPDRALRRSTTGPARADGAARGVGSRAAALLLGRGRRMARAHSMQPGCIASSRTGR